MERAINIQGARTHNLKNINCTIPHRQLTVITGVSGSGKSSLAFDTLFAEGQMRYVESLSAYSRQFLERMQRPDVDRITGIQPAIAMEQKNPIKTARSTVGTATEINDYLRLLFANIGRTICSKCALEVKRFTPEEAADEVMRLPEGSTLLVLAPLTINKGHLRSLKAELTRNGFRRVRIDGSIEDVASLNRKTIAGQKQIELIVDRVVLNRDARGRVTEALEAALKAGGGTAAVVVAQEGRKDE
ncbi:MAG: hypothetical protein QGD94_05670, partial [Planctomycetia bacterium]|nr:hypothetical protein [Planctomycetia bacterium]